jgi:hypothetical protein
LGSVGWAGCMGSTGAAETPKLMMTVVITSNLQMFLSFIKFPFLLFSFSPALH